jgi:hypothetical protein
VNSLISSPLDVLEAIPLLSHAVYEVRLLWPIWVPAQKTTVTASWHSSECCVLTGHSL